MSDIELVERTDDGLSARHKTTGHVFTYRVEDGDLVPGPVREGHGPKDPGDVAADVRAFARGEARRLGLIA